MDEYQDPPPDESTDDPYGYWVYTDPHKPPEWIPGPGWWEFISGAWRWVSSPPKTVSP